MDELKLNPHELVLTLPELQDRIKRQPESYRLEFAAHFKVFVEKLDAFKENPAKKDTTMMDYFKFMAHISGVYQQQLAAFLTTGLLNILQQYYAILHPDVRTTLVSCLKVMRGKDIVAAATVLPVFLKLFRCKDKDLRELLHGSIISDLKGLNAKSKNHPVNKKLQAFIHGLLQDPNEDAAKRALVVMIELYKRKIWNDDKTVNTIWQGVLHANPKIIVAATKFFLVLDYDYRSDSESEDSSDQEDARELLKHHKVSKLKKAQK